MDTETNIINSKWYLDMLATFHALDDPFSFPRRHAFTLNMGLMFPW